MDKLIKFVMGSTGAVIAFIGAFRAVVFPNVVENLVIMFSGTILVFASQIWFNEGDQ